MATLEIHEAGQRVRRVRIGRDQPVMFGTNPLCDIQLNDPTMAGFHGRIRWTNTNFKVEAVHETSFVEVNGRKVKSKGIRQGDEIRAGQTRLFLLSVEDDGPDHGEKTVILDPPPAYAAEINPPDMTEAESPDFEIIESDPHQPVAVPELPPTPAYHKMEMAPPSLEFLNEGLDEDEEATVTLRRPTDFAPMPLPKRDGPPIRRRGFKDFEGVNEIEDDPGDSSATDDEPDRSITKLDSLKRWVASLRGIDWPPDDDRVFTSPIVLGLAGTFVVLVTLSVGLYQFIVHAQARQRFASATDHYDGGDFRGAIRDYDAYLLAEPTGEKSSKAQVYRSLARVRQHTSATSGSWTNALKEARAMVDDVSDLPEYRDVSVDLAEEIRKTAGGMLDRARDLADQAWLQEARAAIELHARVAGSAAGSLLDRSPVPAKLVEAEAAIRQATDLKATIAAVDAAIAANHPGDAYRARSSLLRRYPSLVANQDLSGRLGKINDLVRSAVRFDPTHRPGLTEPVAEPLGPPTSLVYRLDPAKSAERSGPVAFALADGWAWGVDAATGAPLWQVPVGLASPFPPVRIEGGGASVPILMIDARSNELVCREGRSGRFVWRQTLEGVATDPPILLGSRILQPLADGRVVEIDLRTGDLRGTLHLGQRICRSLVLNETGNRAFLLGDADCLFVLGLDPLECAAVEFLGHEAGSVACTPTRAGRLLILPENRTLDAGRWRVFLLGEAGGGLKLVQEIPIAGWTWGSPVAAGSVVWSASDRGEVIAFAVGRLDKPNPLAVIARTPPAPTSQGPAFPFARSEREFVVGSGFSAQYDLDMDHGQLAPVWTLSGAGHALAPPQNVARLTILTAQAVASGGSALWGLDPASGAVRWRTELGSPWPIPWSESSSGDAISTLYSDGRALSLIRDALQKGGFLEQPLSVPGATSVVTPGATRIEVDDTTILIPTPDANQILVRDSAGGFSPVVLPTRLAALPLVVGHHLLIPGASGRVYLVDPRTGLSVADPYIPPFDRARPTSWLAPLAVAEDAILMTDAVGTIRRLIVEKDLRPRLVMTADRHLDSPPVGQPAASESALFIVTADGKIRSFSTRDLSPLGSFPMTTPPAIGPAVVNGYAFVVDAVGQVFAFDGDGRRLWTANLKEPRVIGQPIVRDHAVWFVSRDGGGVEALSLDDGVSVRQTRLAVEPVAGLFPVEDDLVIPTGAGTLQSYSPSSQPSPGEPPR